MVWVVQKVHGISERGKSKLNSGNFLDNSIFTSIRILQLGALQVAYHSTAEWEPSEWETIGSETQLDSVSVYPIAMRFNQSKQAWFHCLLALDESETEQRYGPSIQL